MRVKTSTVFTVLGGSAFLIAFGLALQTSRAAGGPAADGGEIFKSKCSSCHAPDGKGYSALNTPDFTDPKVQDSISDKEIVSAIKNGKAGTAMPAFGDRLNEEQIHALLVYLRSLGSKKN